MTTQKKKPIIPTVPAHKFGIVCVSYVYDDKTHVRYFVAEKAMLAALDKLYDDREYDSLFPFAGTHYPLLGFQGSYKRYIQTASGKLHEIGTNAEDAPMVLTIVESGDVTDTL